MQGSDNRTRLPAALSARLNQQGVFNMMMSDSRVLYTHCSTHLAWITRRAPFGEASLIDTDLTVDFAKETTPKDVVTVIATRPLTDNERWNVVDPGTFIVFRDGDPEMEWGLKQPR